MDAIFDIEKDAINIAKHGLSLGEFRGFDGEPSIAIDDRFDYGETRYQARGRIDGKGYCVVYTVSSGGFRIISFRRAHEKEMRRHEQEPPARRFRRQSRMDRGDDDARAASG